MTMELLCVGAVAVAAFTLYTPAELGAVKWMVCPSRLVCVSSAPTFGSMVHFTPAESLVWAVSAICWHGVRAARRGEIETGVAGLVPDGPELPPEHQ